MSAERIEAELNLLKGWFGSDLEYLTAGHWVRLSNYAIPSELWQPRVIEVCFQIPEALPGQAPYAFYVRPNLSTTNGAGIGNYTFPATTVFGADWGQMSWSPSAWTPGVTPEDGSNMLEFARSFADRFREGP